MRTIGLVGGMSWESTVDYYRYINEEVRARMGGHHSARIAMVSLDLAELVAAADAGGDERVALLLDAALDALARAGADFALLCANTPHVWLERLTARKGLPIVHIAEPLAAAAAAEDRRALAILGTRRTMEAGFYAEHLSARGISTIVPSEDERQFLDQLIVGELTRGERRAGRAEEMRALIAGLAERGADGVALACTELPLVVSAASSPIPLFDTTRLHAAAAVRRALEP